MSENNKASVSLEDCLRLFKQEETLDEQNMWRCSTCKEDVKAIKTLEIFRVPRILIISLKRFKSSRFGLSQHNNHKLDTHVDFPLEGLDMKPFVLSESQKAEGSLIYDCFAVSNHFGSQGYGHYTAFGKNYLTSKWYNFDDSSCTLLAESTSKLKKEIVTKAAYSLFYRLREDPHDQTPQQVDFDRIAQKPSKEFLEQIQSQVSRQRRHT